MSNDSAGRTSRSTSGGAPMGSTVAIVVTAIAVILGFLILRKVNDGADAGTTPGSTVPPTTQPVDSATTITFPATTLPQVDKTATKVQVANASNASGVAGQMTKQLAAAGYSTAEATNATSNPKLDVSKVIFDSSDPNGEAVAGVLAATMGGIAVEAAPAPPPVKDGAFAAGSGVILLLGNDLAGKTLDQLAKPTAPSVAPTTPVTQITSVATTTG